MTGKIQFTKMHGAGNDYIYVNTMNFPIPNPEALSIRLSTYHTGIGSDGLVLIGASAVADFSMRIFNADGSEAMMCGNASRCIGKYIYDHKLSNKTQISLETLSGIKLISLHVIDKRVESVTVDMGKPCYELVDFDGTGKRILKETLIENGGYRFYGTAISVGNPHLVIFVDNIDMVNLAEVGPLFERHPWFPGRINVEFAEVKSPDVIRMRVWERGSGITMACGTGACATATAALLTGRSGSKVDVEMDGGTLTLETDETTGNILMTGEAATVFEGEIEL